MRQKKEVAKALSLITQLGVSMLSPILVCIMLSKLMTRWFDVDWMLGFLLLGLAAGIRGCYLLLAEYFHPNSKKEE